MTEVPPLFSVIIPTYNRAAKVVRAVESVLAQTFQDFDLWVIDDGSTDPTAQLLQPYLDRIHYVVQENGGVASARNRGIQASAGKYVAFLDSDDRWYPQKLASFASAIRTHPDAGLFYSQIDVVNTCGKHLWSDQSRQVGNDAYLVLLKGNFIALSSVAINRSCLETTGYFDVELRSSEDWDLWLRIAQKYPLQLIPEILTIYERSGTDTLTTHTREWLNSHDKVLEKAFSRDPALSPSTRRNIQAHIAYVKGRICLESNDPQQALQWFSHGASLQPALFKAQIYRLLLTWPVLRRFLPTQVLRRLRFPIPSGDK